MIKEIKFIIDVLWNIFVGFVTLFLFFSLYYVLSLYPIIPFIVVGFLLFYILGLSVKGFYLNKKQKDVEEDGNYDY
jgi:cobalamin biosynthesis protein CobD/CbiB